MLIESRFNMRSLVDWRRLSLVAAVVVAAVVASAVPGAASPPEGKVHAAGSRSMVSGSYIVVLKPQVVNKAHGVDAAARALAKSHAGHVKRVWDGLHAFSVTMSESSARQLAAEPAVALVEQDQLLAAARPRGG